MILIKWLVCTFYMQTNPPLRGGCEFDHLYIHTFRLIDKRGTVLKTLSVHLKEPTRLNKLTQSVDSDR